MRPSAIRPCSKPDAKLSISWLAESTTGMASTAIFDVGAATGGRFKESAAASLWATLWSTRMHKMRNAAPTGSTREKSTMGVFDLLSLRSRAYMAPPGRGNVYLKNYRYFLGFSDRSRGV